MSLYKDIVELLDDNHAIVASSVVFLVLVDGKKVKSKGYYFEKWGCGIVQSEIDTKPTRAREKETWNWMKVWCDSKEI